MVILVHITAEAGLVLRLIGHHTVHGAGTADIMETGQDIMALITLIAQDQM